MTISKTYEEYFGMILAQELNIPYKIRVKTFWDPAKRTNTLCVLLDQHMVSIDLGYHKTLEDISIDEAIEFLRNDYPELFI